MNHVVGNQQTDAGIGSSPDRIGRSCSIPLIPNFYDAMIPHRDRCISRNRIRISKLMGSCAFAGRTNAHTSLCEAERWQHEQAQKQIHIYFHSCMIKSSPCHSHAPGIGHFQIQAQCSGFERQVSNFCLKELTALQQFIPPSVPGATKHHSIIAMIYFIC
jgi:hypothetical protein